MRKVEGMIKTFGWYLSSEKLFKIVSWLIWVIKGINSRGVTARMGHTLWRRGWIDFYVMKSGGTISRSNRAQT